MSNEQKTPFSRTLNAWAQQKALDEIQKRGQALPGSVVSVDGAIITVSFETSDPTLPQVAMPLFGPQYIRYPIQVGDLGVAFPADAYLGGVSGLGGGTANLIPRGNLSTLVWFPVGNADWTDVASNYLVMYGPDGVILQDVATASPSTYVKLTTGEIQMLAGGHSIIINSSGVTIDGKVFLTHEHLPGTYVAGSTAVTGDSGAVV